jgi:hypothetical protein
VSRRRVGLWLATIVGAFLWPTQLYIGTILSLFPNPPLGGDESPGMTTQQMSIEPKGNLANAPWRLDIVVAGLATYWWCLWSMYVCGRIQIPLFGGLFPIRSLLGLSLFFSAVYVFCGLRPLLNDVRLYRFSSFFSWRHAGWAIGSLLVAIGVKYVQRSMSNRPGYFGQSVYGLVIGLSAVAKPGLFLLAHLVYFGPFWLLAAACWPAICRQIHRQGGIGLTLVAAIGVCHALDAESRHLVYLVPMFLPFVVQVIDRLEWSRNQLIFLAGLSVLTSKCWLYAGGPFIDNANAFPDQFFWMNVGTFMSDQTYIWQLIAALVCAFLMKQNLHANPRECVAEPASTSTANTPALQRIRDDFCSEIESVQTAK